MITRRTVIQGGLSGFLVASASPLLALPLDSPPALPFHAVLFDGRYEAGRRFGEESARAGMTVHDTGGDITDIWYRNLRTRWKETDVAVAGLTSFSSFFSLKLMTDAVRIRPQYLGYHHLGTGVRHELFGPDSFTRSARLGASDAQWPSEMARLLLSWPRDAGRLASGKSNLATAAERDLAAGSLVSWILAPRLR